MSIKRTIVGIACAAMIVLIADVVSSQDYPSKPVRIIASGIGGGTDYTARLIAPEVSVLLGQAVIIDNRPTSLTGEIVSKAPPDGYTLLVNGGSFYLGPLLEKMPYDPVRDFSAIILVSTEPNVLVVHPSLPVKSVKDLIALAKARPGELNYASGGAGGANHLAAELLKYMAGINIVRVPYKSPGQALTDLIGGHVQLRFVSAVGAAPHVKSGRLRAVAVTSAQPSALTPGLPTVAASGLSGYELTGTTGIWAPAKTPAAIINRLNHEIMQVLKRADVKQKLFDVGAEAAGSSPEQFSAMLKAEIAKVDKLIRDAGIKAD